jgi:hypothetical protein
MSTGQIIQIAATAVGAYFGGPWGALIGSQAGGYVGRSVDAKHTDVSAEGPRLSDFKVQLASYGVAVPRVYGRASIAGNVIWSSDIIEHVTTSSSTQDAGKGGGGDSQTVNLTTYSYSVHLAIGLCAGPIAGLGKIWANGKLIYNGKAGTDAQTVLASQSLADGVRLYLGSETQSADRDHPIVSRARPTCRAIAASPTSCSRISSSPPSAIASRNSSLRSFATASDAIARPAHRRDADDDRRQDALL